MLALQAFALKQQQYELSNPHLEVNLGKHSSKGTKLRHQAPLAKRPRWASAVLVLGELSLTFAALVAFFVVWVLYIDSPLTGAQQVNSATKATNSLLENQVRQASEQADIPVPERVADYQEIGVLYVPRFGAHYKRVIKETVDVSRVLNSLESGVGHYPNSAMPGELGNFAVAGHDIGWGRAFGDVPKLQIGDPVYVLTKTGWYTYRYRNTEYVEPDAISVLYPVPQVIDAPPHDRFLTMTTCNPPGSIDERMIAYAVFEGWQPADKIPAELSHLVKA